MLKLMQKLKNYFELKKVKKQLISLNTKYFASVRAQWEIKGFSDNANCFPISTSDFKDENCVPLSTGIDLVLANNEETKNIFLVHLTEEDENIIKKYVELKGFSTKGIKSDII